MNYRIVGLIQVIFSAIALAQGNKFSAQRDKSSPDWNEALNDFKSLVHVITFGEDIPSHHSNPLQILVQDENSGLGKNPFELPNGWFGKNKNAYKINSKRRFDKKLKSRKNTKKSKKSNTKIQNFGASQLHSQSADDIALLNFIVQLEEPHNTRNIMSKNEKHLSALLMAEERYNQIKEKTKLSKSLPKKSKVFKSNSNSKVILDTNRVSFKNFNEKADNTKKNPKDKKWYKRIDAKSAKNTLTLSVAFGVIVTALFCVVVQLFKLFANPKGSTGGSAFDQINRRSTYGYDRIALDVEDDEEIAQA